MYIVGNWGLSGELDSSYSSNMFFRRNFIVLGIDQFKVLKLCFKSEIEESVRRGIGERLGDL